MVIGEYFFQERFVVFFFKKKLSLMNNILERPVYLLFRIYDKQDVLPFLMKNAFKYDFHKIDRT